MLKQTKKSKKSKKLEGLKKEIIEGSVLKSKNTTLEKCRTSLLNDVKSFDISFVELGVKVEDTYDQLGMIEFFLGKAYILVGEFIKEPSNNTYNSLLNGYFLYVIYFTACKENNREIQNGFESDICLSLLFAMTYCDSDIQSHMMEALNFYKLKCTELRPGKLRFFSKSTLLPLCYYFYQKNKNNKPWLLTLENIVDKDYNAVNEDIMSNITPLYQQAIDNLYTEDMQLFQKIIVDMCKYHLKNSQGNYLLEFNGDLKEYFPIEILFLLKQRVDNGYSIEGVHHVLIDDFLPYLLNDFEISEENKQILYRGLNQ